MTTSGRQWSEMVKTWSQMVKSRINRLIKPIIIILVPIDSKSSVEFINVEKIIKMLKKSSLVVDSGRKGSKSGQNLTKIELIDK